MTVTAVVAAVTVVAGVPAAVTAVAAVPAAVTAVAAVPAVVAVPAVTVVPAVAAVAVTVAAVAATVKSAPTRWADRQLMKTRQRARTTRAMLMRHETSTPCLSRSSCPSPRCPR